MVAQKNIVLTCVTSISVAYHSHTRLVLGIAPLISSVKLTQLAPHREKSFMKKV